MCFVGICGAELDWSMDVADGAGNGRVRMPGIRAMKILQNLSQAMRNAMVVAWTVVAAGNVI